MKKRILSTALALILAISTIFIGGTAASAASNLTGVGLAELGLKAYRDGWQYNYGSYGEFNGSGVRQSDCSGLIYSYLCWTDESSAPSPNYSMPRGASSQYVACSEKGDMSTLPRTHGVLLFYKVGVDDCDHVGIYVGNDMGVDNSSYGVNMRYMQVSTYSKWNAWGKLDCVEYPTNGWYEFDGSPFFYQNGEYVINTTLSIDGTSYTFDGSGTPSPMPSGYENGSGTADGSGGSSNSNNNSGSSTESALYSTTVTASALNMRTGASTSSSVIRVLSNGTSLEVLDTSNSEWYKVRTSDGTTGYVSSQYLASNSSSSSDNVNISAYTTADVNFRTEASTNSSVISVLDNGTAITIIEKTNSSWYKVKTSSGQEGYIFASYIAEGNSSSNNGNDSSNEDSSSGSTSGYSAVTTVYVNLRQGTSTSTSVIKVLDSGTSLTVTDTSNSEWYKVSLSDGTSGYIYSIYLSQTGSGNSGSSTTGTTTAYVNLRSGPSLNDLVLTVVPSGSTITITEKTSSEWYKIKTSSGQEGYMSAQYIN